MGIRIFHEGNILRHEFEADWSLADYYHAIDLSYSMMAAMEDSAHMIVDLSRSQVPATRLIAAALYQGNKTPPNQGLMLVIKSDIHPHAAYELGKRISPEAYLHFVENLNEAYIFIATAQAIPA